MTEPMDYQAAKALADQRAAVAATIRLTPTQAEEVEHGLDVDSDEGRPPWGAVRRSGKRTADLDVYDLNGAIYRVTSRRDVALDGAQSWTTTTSERRAYGATARSLQTLTDRLVDAAGGPDNLTTETRSWL